MPHDNTYSGVIKISVNDFRATSFAHAEALIEQLVNALAEGTENTDTLPWDTVEWETLVEPY